ncbi:MAG: hypothetical protein PHX68_03270 [Alphaproteobacteria bacterium]|nr:hypothetical protein [Alphaproteobacteria bacterium]
MQKYIALTALALGLSACTTLTRQEEVGLQQLKRQGVTIDKPVGSWEKPANPLTAGLLNLLPGIGNFYLAAGNAGESPHYIYGFANLLLWPYSILWGIPEAAVDAQAINKRDLLYYYQYDKLGIKELSQSGIRLD